VKKNPRKEAELKRLYKKLENLKQQKNKVINQIVALELVNEYDISEETKKIQGV